MHFASREGSVRRKLLPIRAVSRTWTLICLQMHIKHRDQGLEGEENLCFTPSCFVWPSSLTPPHILSWVGMVMGWQAH